MTDSSDARATALACLAEVAGRAADEIAATHDLVADLDIDSPKALQLVVEIEETLGVEVDDEELASLRTVGELVDHVVQLAARPAGSD